MVILLGPHLSQYRACNENYESAINTLKGRFGRKAIIVQFRLDTLLSLQPVRSASQMKELRMFYDTLEVIVKSLENMKIDLKNYGNLLFEIVTKLIPSNIMLD